MFCWNPVNFSFHIPLDGRLTGVKRALYTHFLCQFHGNVHVFQYDSGYVHVFTISALEKNRCVSNRQWHTWSGGGQCYSCGQVHAWESASSTTVAVEIQSISLLPLAWTSCWPKFPTVTYSMVRFNLTVAADLNNLVALVENRSLGHVIVTCWDPDIFTSFDPFTFSFWYADVCHTDRSTALNQLSGKRILQTQKRYVK